ncbi:hypothetical protein WMR10_001371 [Stenotrophomonas maltophilia]
MADRRGPLTQLEALPPKDFDINTSEGGRRFVARYFAAEMLRPDFADYIATRLAADFACALAKHLKALSVEQTAGLSLSKAEASLTRQWFDHAQDTATAGYLGTADYVLAARLYEIEGMRVPNSIKALVEGKEAGHG